MLFIATISKYELFVRVEQVCYLLKGYINVNLKTLKEIQDR